MTKVLAAVALAGIFFTGCTSSGAKGKVQRSTPPASAQLVTEIYVRDLKKSQAFYEQLGFKTTLVEPTFRELQFGGRKFFLSQRDAAPPRQPAANIRIGVADVDATFKLAQKTGARVLSPLQDHEWGERDFTIADPDNFGLRFASLLPGGHW